MPYYYYSFIIIVPAIIFAVFCQAKLKSTYAKFSQMNNTRGLTGAAAAKLLLSNNGVNDVSIEMTQGKLSDHFDPRGKVIRLSPEVFNGSSIAAVGIACHEAGHACQHNENYFPIKIRNAVIPVTNIGSALGVPLALIGLIFNAGILIDIGLILYASVAVFQLVTLPVEFNASRRALATISTYDLLSGDEYSGAKKVLTAAAMTYVAALVSSLASLLRMLLIFNNRRR